MLNLDLEISNYCIMNKLKSILLFAAFACAISCEQPEPDPVPATKLESPTITLASKTDSSFTISWEAIENAECYSVDFMGDVTDTESLEAGYSGLESGQTYEISVKAVPADLEKYTESDWTKFSVTLDTSATVEPEPEKYFDINIDFDKEAMMMYCSITPTDMEMYYYRETMTQAQVNELGGGSVEDAWQAALDNYYAIFGSSIWDHYITVGFDEWMADTTYEETEYVLAAGIDNELNRITPVEYATLETGEAPRRVDGRLCRFGRILHLMQRGHHRGRTHHADRFHRHLRDGAQLRGTVAENRRLPGCSEDQCLRGLRSPYTRHERGRTGADAGLCGAGL